MQVLGKVTKVWIIALVGLYSVLITSSRLPTKSVFEEFGSLNSSLYTMNFYDSSGYRLFSVSPLNDYYYDVNLKDHLLNKVINSNNGTPLIQFWLDIKQILTNKNEFIWNTYGQNTKTNASIEYIAKLDKGKLELTRQIKFDKGSINGVGEVVNFCANCLIIDEKKRLLFNGAALTEEKLQTASELKLTPFALEENQSLPDDSHFISILSPDGKVRAEFPIVGTQVFLQSKWNLLEFKTTIEKSTKTSLKQEIKIYSGL